VTVRAARASCRRPGWLAAGGGGSGAPVLGLRHAAGGRAPGRVRARRGRRSLRAAVRSGQLRLACLSVCRLCESGYRRPVPPASRAAGHAALRHHRERVRPPRPRAGVPRGWPGRARRAGGNVVTRVLVLVWALASATTAAQEHPQRIVSLAPSVTEVLFEAGLGPRVAGVTSYCRFPREVLALPKVGGYLTPSYEALVALHPDLVVTLPEQADLQPRLPAL